MFNARTFLQSCAVILMLSNATYSLATAQPEAEKAPSRSTTDTAPPLNPAVDASDTLSNQLNVSSVEWGSPKLLCVAQPRYVRRRVVDRDCIDKFAGQRLWHGWGPWTCPDDGRTYFRYSIDWSRHETCFLACSECLQRAANINSPGANCRRDMKGAICHMGYY